jgi:hypothetical protein
MIRSTCQPSSNDTRSCPTLPRPSTPSSGPCQAGWLSPLPPLPSPPPCPASCEVLAAARSSNCHRGKATRAGRFAGRRPRLSVSPSSLSSPNTSKTKTPSARGGWSRVAGPRFRVPRGLPVQPNPSCRAGCGDPLFTVASPSTFSPTVSRKAVAAVSSVALGVSTSPSGRGAQNGLVLNGDLFGRGDSSNAAAWTWRPPSTVDGRAGESVDGWSAG